MVGADVMNMTEKRCWCYLLRVLVVAVALLAAPILYYRYERPNMILPTIVIGTSKSKSAAVHVVPTANTTIMTTKGERKHRLPSLEHGGIVFFLHIPKCGGTTIRELVKYQRGRRRRRRRSNVHYIYLTGLRDYQYTVQSMNQWVINGTEERKVAFIEYHALDRNCPTFLQLSQADLPNWKNLAHQNNIPFFAFSIVREPISHTISFFNFYHGIPQNPKRFDLITITNATTTTAQQQQQEQAFVETTLANPQCLFLAHNEDAYTKTGQDLRQQLVHDDCHKAWAGLVKLMDWVGTTDRIGNETLPLLKELFSTNPNTNGLIHNLNTTANKSTGTSSSNSSSGIQLPILQQATLSQSTIDYIRQMTRWDQELYDNVRRNFSYESWFHNDDAFL